MWEEFLGILGSSLSIWENKEARKYYDRFIKYTKELRKEEGKDTPDDIRVADLKFELRLLGKAYRSEVDKAGVEH